MLAKNSARFPKDDGWIFEPKWDGFRVVIFRDGDALYLQSRSLKPLLRYFPELDAPLKAALPERCVVDGELIIAQRDRLDFDALQMRLHPAASRIDLLANKTPAQVVAWDLLALGDEDLSEVPFEQRRSLLEDLLRDVEPPIHLTPATRDVAQARDWFERFEGAGLDGVIAKRADGVYEPGKRAMLKLKHQRTVDCVLAGFRWHKNGPGELLGSMILGLYGDDGRLHQIGVAASFTAAKRKSLMAEIEPLRDGALDAHPWAAWAEQEGRERRPGVQSRWSAGKSLSWEPVRVERVVEVGYNHFDSGRLRHPGHFKRWRDDREPASCTLGQVEVAAPFELTGVLGDGA